MATTLVGLCLGCREPVEHLSQSKSDNERAAVGDVPAVEIKPMEERGVQQAKHNKLATDVTNQSEQHPSASRPSEVNDTTGKRIAAEARFVAGPGVKLEGEAELKEVAGGVRIEVDVKDAPAGLKGIHIHQKGDCSDIPGKSMGEHLVTTMDEHHGLPSTPHHHTGDLGNIQIDQDGDGKLTFVVPAVHLEGNDERSLAHRAIVIHEKKDVGSGPTGESGKPIACAVIQPS
ncbi:MAG: superoxide dismutase family protein [Myxococcales bacterium]